LTNMETKMTLAEVLHSKITRTLEGTRMMTSTRTTSERLSSRTIKNSTRKKRAGLCTIL
jgi:hypothetical protein